MNIDKLEVGMTFKNYKVLCEVLGWEVKVSTGTKNAQFKELSRYCSFSKDGHKITIEKIHDETRDKIDGRGKSEGSRRTVKEPLTESHSMLASEWMIDKNGSGIPEEITRTSRLNYWWKCSECSAEVYDSPLNRLKNSKNRPNNKPLCPCCCLSKNAQKVYNLLRVCETQFNTEFTFEDLRGLSDGLLRFDFAVFSDNKLVGLIEYDGQYHDKHLNPDLENYRIISVHDKLKDEYCLKNDIPLLRIHHSHMSNYILMVTLFLQDFSIESHIVDKFMKLKDVELERQRIQEEYRVQMEEINSQINQIQFELNETSREIEKSFSTRGSKVTSI